LRHPDRWLEDCEGIELPNLEAALEETQKANRDLLIDLDDKSGWAFEIADGDGTTLLTVPVQETVPLERPPQVQDVRPSCGPGATLH
jgi:hypothetical protein